MQLPEVLTITISEAARRMGKHRSTVQGYVRRGTLRKEPDGKIAIQSLVDAGLLSLELATRPLPERPTPLYTRFVAEIDRLEALINRLEHILEQLQRRP